MSIERSNQSSSQVESTDRAGNDKQDTRPRDPAPREKIDKFQRLMQEKQDQAEKPPLQAGKHEGMSTDHATDNAVARRQPGAEQGADDPLRHRHDDTGLSSSNLQAIDATAMYQAQAAIRDGLPQAVAPPPLNPNAFADMVERHLKQFAAERGTAAGDGKVLLRMADATLPGTDLLLSRTADGWLLRADVRSRSSFDAIRDAAPALAKRFAERNLGVLSFDPHFHG
jgi:hypothetical protein